MVTQNNKRGVLMPFRQVQIEETFISGGIEFVKISKTHAQVSGTARSIMINSSAIVEVKAHEHAKDV